MVVRTVIVNEIWTFFCEAMEEGLYERISVGMTEKILTRMTEPEEFRMLLWEHSLSETR
jgi:hypothetical protein